MTDIPVDPDENYDVEDDDLDNLPTEVVSEDPLDGDAAYDPEDR